MNAPASLSADTLYELAEAKNLWPEDKRVIYCNVTGRPWGVVSDDYVRYAIKHYGAGNTEELNRMIDRMTLFAGPSPMWQTKTPNMLVVNQHADPAGFLVYLLNWVLRLEAAAKEAAKGDLDVLKSWRLSMIQLYRDLQMIDKDFMHKVNDTILVLSGEGLCPEPHAFPSRELGPYGERRTLERLMQVCKKYYQRYGGVNRYGRERHEIHHRTFLKTYSVEQATTKQQDDLIKLMLVDLFNQMDDQSSKDEHRAAKKSTGIASATFADLRELEREQKELAAKKSIAKVYEHGQKIMLKFGQKKDS